MKVFLTATLGFVSMCLAQGEDLDRARAEFAAQDKVLNATYQDLKKSLPERAFARVQEDQRKWIDHRDYMSAWDSKRLQKNPENDPEYWMSAAQMTASRIAFLKAWKGIGAPPPRGKPGRWDGVYLDGYGGILRIAKRAGKLHFSLEVARGPNFHNGVCGGQAEVNGAMAWFSTRYSPDEAPMWLTFLNNRGWDGRIEVIGENTGFFHGLSAYFEGHYLRVRKLNAKDLAELLKAVPGDGTVEE
ncbi:MAG: lysozyme inhibitor LprI family protein [Roseibacillus sp.]|nr:lysozyme inhibitor LprI family protein [Roseibacillus sp.]